MVIQIGELPTSKPLRTWLAGLDSVQHVALPAQAVWPDPASRISIRAVTDPLSASRWIRRFRGPDGWLETWQAADAAVGGAIDPVLDTPELTEPKVARLLGTELPAEATLFVASSMPIRDVEEFFPARADPPRVLANRGANGIDGTVSSAFGVAATTADPVVLLIGDVALAHDIGGMLSARRTGLKLTIVLINNDGGGIFNFLAIAEGHAAAFAEHVATPHGLDFAHAAALYGFDHVAPADVGGFTAALHRSLTGDTGTLIEVRTDRAANRALHAQIEAAARAALSRTGPAAAPPA
jgi:2-succinyl-5-enolpyruvyl-6-hydroxy-3-cyclohexene-1-carboxylate synthase